MGNHSIYKNETGKQVLAQFYEKYLETFDFPTIFGEISTNFQELSTNIEIIGVLQSIPFSFKPIY